jgi:hypothetical protein
MAHSNKTTKRKASRPLGTIAGAAKPFDREMQLPKLLCLWPSELRDYSFDGTKRLVDLIRKALLAERRRSAAGHWCYDLNRHLALIEALKEENARLRSLRAAALKAEAAALRRPDQDSACALAQMSARSELVRDADGQRDIMAQHLVDGEAIVG